MYDLSKTTLAFLATQKALPKALRRALPVPGFDLQALIAENALFVINHSGGKDSQAMMIELLKMGIPVEQIVAAHADLGAMEWQGTLDHAQAQCDAAGITLLICKATDLQGTHFDLLDMVDRTFARRPEVPSFPSSKVRNCTSDLKRGPIAREVRRYAEARGFKLIVDCQGIRAAESDSRAAIEPFRLSERKDDHAAGRTWILWCPIFRMTTAQVFATVAAAGQELHWAYAAGNERLSCVFCIMGSRTDLANGARHNPELYARYVAMEAKTGYFMHMDRQPLAALVAEGQAILDRRELAVAA